MSDLKEVLDKMHSALAKELLARIESGEATASELTVARQFLNDNHISGVIKADNPLGKLADKLPTFDDSEQKMYVN